MENSVLPFSREADSFVIICPQHFFFSQFCLLPASPEQILCSSHVTSLYISNGNGSFGNFSYRFPYPANLAALRLSVLEATSFGVSERTDNPWGSEAFAQLHLSD